MTRRRRPLPQAYVVAVLAALAASAVLVQACEQRIAERFDGNAQLRAAIAADVAAAAERAALSAQRNRLSRELGPVLSAQDATSRSAAFVREAAAIALGHHTRVTAVVSAERTSAVVLRPSSADDPKRGLAYEVTLEGRYADVLATLRALSQARFPAAIEIASLTRKNPNALDATLIAAFHVNLGWSSTTEPAHEVAAPH
jgi:hypothetical protein